MVHRRKVSALYLAYKIFHRADHPMKEYLNRFVADRNSRALAVSRGLALVIPRCRTDQFSQSFLPATEHL